MLLLLCVIVAGLVVSVGWGFSAIALIERLRGPLARYLTLGEIGLVGLAAQGVIGMALNAALPLSPAITGVAALLGAAAFASRIGPVWRAHVDRGGSILMPVVLALGAGLAVSRYGYWSAAYHFDTGLYHVQAIRQLMDFPMLLGAANIHMRFGYNSSWAFVAAMQSMGVTELAGVFAVNAVLLLLVLWSLAWRCGDGLRTGKLSAVFALLVILLLLTPAIDARGQVGNPNTDLPTILLVLVAFQLARKIQHALPVEGLAPLAAA